MPSAPSRSSKDQFGQRSTGSFTLVARTDGGGAAAIVPQVRAAAERAAASCRPGSSSRSQPLAEDVVSAQVVSDLEPADAKTHTDAMRKAAGTIEGATLYLTGQAATEHDLDPVFADDLKKGELSSRSRSRS